MISSGLPRALATLTLLCVAASPSPSDAAAPEGDEQRTFYALGLLVAGQLGDFDLSTEEAAAVEQGIADALKGEPGVDPQEYMAKIQTLANARKSAVVEREKTAANAFLAEQSKAEGAVLQESGLIITELKAGDGPSPEATDTVKVHYTGTLRDGTVFDSSVTRGTPAQFPLSGVIPCWTEGVALMKVGGKSRLVCPSDIAYGDRGQPGRIPGGAPLVFEVELLEIVE